jgi:indolepyruvate ferredoxin oxidoreductase
LRRAFELNGVQVERNWQAFEWGRMSAADWPKVQALITPAQVIAFKRTPSVDEWIEQRARWLTDYQNEAYAQRYLELVAQVRSAEQAAKPGGGEALTRVVAQQLYRVMAIKDEYEVARLHSDPAFMQRLRDQFDGDWRPNYHLAPPLFAKRNAKGELLKASFGPWMGQVFKVLARLKGLRGTALDVFGHTAERKEERAWMDEYIAIVGELCATLNADNHAAALEIAQVAEQVRGYGHVKARHLKAARSRWDELLVAWRQPKAKAQAA